MGWGGGEDSVYGAGSDSVGGNGVSGCKNRVSESKDRAGLGGGGGS